MKLIRFLLFNRLTNSYSKQGSSFFFLNKRLSLVLVEFLNLFSIIFFPMILFFIPAIILGNAKGTEHGISNSLLALPFSLLSLIILNKDSWGGQSIIHRLYGYKVVNAKNNQTAGKIQCFMRNLTFVCWYVEIIPLLISPKRRIGDLIAGTKLIEVEISDPKKILDEMAQTKWDKQTKLILLLNTLFLVLSILFFTNQLK